MPLASGGAVKMRRLQYLAIALGAMSSSRRRPMKNRKRCWLQTTAIAMSMIILAVATVVLVGSI